MREAMAIADEILAERRRQIEEEGFTARQDDTYQKGELARAAGSYAIHAGRADYMRQAAGPMAWPWNKSWWKPATRRRDLIRAGALIVAEIERLDREAAAQDGDGFNPLGSGPDAITPRDILNLSAAQAANALEDF